MDPFNICTSNNVCYCCKNCKTNMNRSTVSVYSARLQTHWKGKIVQVDNEEKLEVTPLNVNKIWKKKIQTALQGKYNTHQLALTNS